MEKTLPEVRRLESEIAGFDKVLGGGIVPGSLILICGDSGSGKSTLLIQVFQALARRRETCLYITGEEPVSQLASRFKGLGKFPARLQALHATDIDIMLDRVDEMKPSVVVIDSIQCVEVDEDLEVGSASSIKTAINEFMKYAKAEKVAFIIIGHITKGGSIGGPKTLEHMVDTSVHLTASLSRRVLQCLSKNRFGKTPQRAYFEMTGEGLVEIEEKPDDDSPTTLPPTLTSIPLETL